MPALRQYSQRGGVLFSHIVAMRIGKKNRQAHALAVFPFSQRRTALLLAA